MRIFFYFLISAAFIGAVYWLLLPATKGKFGEWIVSKVVGKTGEGKQYVINDLILSGENGKSSQIDHVVINGGGIWVIETKNYAGRIYGEDRQRQWTQVLAYGRVRNRFYNPVRQNYTHMLAIERALTENAGESAAGAPGNSGVLQSADGEDLPKVRLPLHSVVVFVRNNVQFIKSAHVATVFNLRKTLNSVPETVLSEDLQKRYYEQLLSLRERQISAEEHVKNVREEQFRIENNICPRCGRSLVLKHGKYGDFYGCPGYPGCTFTKKADGKTGTNAGERK